MRAMTNSTNRGASPRFLAVSCAVGVALGACCAPQAAAQQVPASALGEGDWVSVPFADAMTRLRSAVAAAEAHPPLALHVTREGGVTRLAVTSFHETQRLRVISASPTSVPGTSSLELASDEGVPRGPARVDVRLVNDRGVEELQTRLGMDDEQDHRYRRLPADVDTWAARVLVAGDYADASGRAWHFGSDRQAATPEGAFVYSVALDPSEAGCDYFQTPDPAARGGQRRTGFRWRGAALELYRIVYDSDGPPIACAPSPFAVLSRTPAASPAAATACGLSRLAITQVTPGQWEHLESRTRTFTLAHWNFGARPNPTAFTERGITVTHADGSTCQFDPTIYGRDLWVSRDERTIAVVSSSGSSADLRFVDARTCAERHRLDVSGPAVDVGANLVSHPGDCEMADASRASCRPASYWILDEGCRPGRSDAASDAWTRERFGVVFWGPGELASPFTANASWLGPSR